MKYVNNKGQVMVLSVMMLGGLILSATTIAGLLLVYQIKQANDAVNSAKAIFAADAGIEWQIYNFYNSTANSPPLQFSNGASVLATSQAAPSGEVIIRSTGSAGNVVRALENIFSP